MSSAVVIALSRMILFSAEGPVHASEYQRSVSGPYHRAGVIPPDHKEGLQ